MSEENKIIATVNWVIDWFQDRMKERTSWDGLTIIVISVMALVASPLIRYAAWLGLAYGVWTLWKKESWNPFATKTSSTVVDKNPGN